MTADRVWEEYERIANSVLRQGYLGFGISEDWLIESGRWVSRPLVPGGGSFIDFFRFALNHHVALLCAVDVELEDQESTQDLHEFLQVLLKWISAAPYQLLAKSPEPLHLVVSSRGGDKRLGSHVMQPGGPSVVYWEVFRSLRRTLKCPSYEPFTEQIGQTLAHEMIGHQLAFCSSAGPLIPRPDLADIFELVGIRELKLVGGQTIDITSFLAEEDLLAVLRRVEYVVSLRNPAKYYGNITELIAFAVEGSHPEPHWRYEEILRILKRNLLRLDAPMSESGPHGQLLHAGYIYNGKEFEQYYIERCHDGWLETPAIEHEGRWVTLVDLQRAALAKAPLLQSAAGRAIAPGKTFHLTMSHSGYLLEIDNHRILTCPFGLFELNDEGHFQDRPNGIELSHVTIRAAKNAREIFHGFKVLNIGNHSVSYRFLEIDASLKRCST